MQGPWGQDAEFTGLVVGTRFDQDEGMRQETPRWALDLAASVASTHQVAVPQIGWRQTTQEESSGRYYRGRARITISAGGDLEEARMVLLHELAHHLAYAKHRPERGHGEPFYFVCWALYLAYDVPLDLAAAGEFRYKASAERVVRKMGVRLDERGKAAGAYGDLLRQAGLLRGGVRAQARLVAAGGGNVASNQRRLEAARQQLARCERAAQAAKERWKAMA